MLVAPENKGSVMGFVGGNLGYRIMKRISPGDAGYMDGTAYENKSKLDVLLGNSFWDKIKDKVVIDFGCGLGAEAVEIAQRGAKKVIGVDIIEEYLESSRALAARLKVANCEFATTPTEKVEVIVTLDSFEHFENPAAILDVMRDMLAPDGRIFVSFGPTWYHPLGGHLLNVFPWSHLIFTEWAQLRWRADIRSDKPTTFKECGLNQMTIRRFEQYVAESAFKFSSFEVVPIKKLKSFHKKWTREFTSAIVRCELVLR
jgi:SAM-dependent methyltransferase